MFKAVGPGNSRWKNSDGSVNLAPEFGQKWAELAKVRVEAPERVHPTGDVSIADSVAKLSDNDKSFAELKSDLTAYDLSQHTFPHPYFGNLTAAEWLIIAGGHEKRHTKQIQEMLDSIRGK